VACEYLGYTRDELLSLNPLDLLAPASRFLFRERLNRYMEGESVPSQVEAELLAKDGTRVWVLLSANFRSERGRIVGASVVAQDISQRKMMENAARKNEERFRLIANHSVDAAFFHDRRLRYTWITKTFGSFSLEEILGNDDLALWGQEGGGEVYEFKRAVLTQKTRMRSEFALPLADGQSAHFEITCNPRTDFDGQVIGLSGFMRDVTERRRAEEEIRKREEQLREEQKNLEEANAAFKLLLKHRDDEKQNHQEELFKNIKNLIAPYLERLKNTNLDRSQRDLVEIVEQNLAAILPGFTAQEFDLLENLTPRELEVVNMIKLGYSNKKISDLMNVSEQTVSFHRKNIRKKLGLTHGGRNLRSHLLRLSR
jgi:PAS domain S-box-containing protein